MTRELRLDLKRRDWDPDPNPDPGVLLAAQVTA
jgi:hypothetical protein